MFIEEAQMDYESLYCPNRHCRYYGVLFKQGRMVKNGSSHAQKQVLCKACGSSISLRYATAYADLEADPAIDCFAHISVRKLLAGYSAHCANRQRHCM